MCERFGEAEYAQGKRTDQITIEAARRILKVDLKYCNRVLCCIIQI